MVARIDKFVGEQRFLSNFYPAKVVLDGMEFSTVEHAYQAAKATDRKERRFIQGQPKPGQAKMAGRRIRSLRPDWDAVKVDIMRELLRQKFEDGALRWMLMQTDDAELVEGNDWGDVFWGECKGVGSNWLGRLLMQIRSEIGVEV